MKTWTRAAAAALLLASAAAALIDDATLVVGSPAPALTAVNWLQGTPVTGWEPGHIYVLDFWATWCGPCRKSIPHVNALSRELADSNVHVIGVAIWPRDGMVPTADFVTQQGDDMSYAISEDIGAATAATFMAAAGRSGIPTVMVVNGEGKLSWMGHPEDGLTQELARLVPGFDAAAFDKDRLAREATLNELLAQVNAANEAEDWQKFADAAGAVLELDPSQYAIFGVYGYQALLKLDDPQPAKDWGRKVLDGALHNLAEPLNILAWSIVDPEADLAAERRDLELATAAITRAAELTAHKDASVLDTLARVQFVAGHVDEAVATQRAAVELADASLKPELQARLDEYLKAGKG